MNAHEASFPRSQAAFEQESDAMAVQIATVVGDGHINTSLVLSALRKVHRATFFLLNEDGRRTEALALAIYARQLLAVPAHPLMTHAPACASSHSSNHKGA